VKQGVAEWYRIQLKAKTRKGLEQHAIDGYNNGRVPFGYTADRIAHPVPTKAGQGRVRTRLAADAQAGPWVTRMFEWRVLEQLSREAIAGRLEAVGVPSPGSGGGWGPMTVGKILANPKYTGYMVYGRTKNTGKSQRPGQRKIRSVPRDQWTWSPAPVHPALVSRQLWEEAQKIGAAHEGVRDTEVPTRREGRRYPLRSRLHCSQCGRRMTGSTRPGRREGQCYTYYVCPWRESNPRDVHRCEHHVRTAVREDTITSAVAAFLDQFVLGHDRAAMLQAHLPASAAEAAARRAAQAAQLRKRIREHHTDLYNAAAALNAQLEAITAQAASENDPALIGELPYAPGFLLQAPDHVREALYAALNLHCTFRGDKQQITIRAVITDTTPGIIAALIADPRTDTGSPKRSPGPLADPNNSAIAAETRNKARTARRGTRRRTS
jgi:Recombinase/Recombinase zinc beta ribbon domain